MCSRIDALMHGTTDTYLENILETNQITARKSSMGLNVAVSTYPILDCDIGHEFNLLEFWGTSKIFIKPSLLIDNPNWQLSVESDVSADWNKMPYNYTNIQEYMPIISRYRSAIWLSRQETDVVRLYGGELAFKNTLTNIKNYILFVAIDDTKPELIQYVMGHGINVIIVHNYVLLFEPDWFNKTTWLASLAVEQDKLRQLLPTLYILSQQRREKQSRERQAVAQTQREKYVVARAWWESTVRKYGPDKLQRILGPTYNAIMKAYDRKDYALIFRVERAEQRLTELHTK